MFSFGKKKLAIEKEKLAIEKTILERENELKEAKNRAKEEYYRIRETINIPDIYGVVTYLKGNLDLSNAKQYLWKEDDSICLFPFGPPETGWSYREPIELIKVNRINLSEIQGYFLLIRSREVILKNMDDSENYFDEDSYDVFERIVPEKASQDGIITIADRKGNYYSDVQSVKDSIKCPKCGSIQITAGNKGFGLGKAAVGGAILGPVGLLGGLVGSKKIIVTCLGCGNKWGVGKQ